MATRLVTHPIKCLRLLFISVGALVALLAMPSESWADSCSGTLPSFCTIPEGPQEAPLIVSLTGLTFAASAQGTVVLYDDSAHTTVSDVVEFSNVAGVATVTFISDGDPLVTASSGLPIIGGFTEGQPISVRVALSNGGFVTAMICSDVSESSTACHSSSDSIALQAVPEPGTFLLTASGVIGSGIWRLRGSSKLKRFLKPLKL